MKKTIIVALAAMLLQSSGIAMAASSPVSFDGSILTHYRWDDSGTTNLNGGKIFLRLNANAPITEDISLYTRLAAEGLNGDKIGAENERA